MDEQLDVLFITETRLSCQGGEAQCVDMTPFLWYSLVRIWEWHQWNCVKFMKQMSPKTCILDPIPASLLFECSNEIVPLLTAIVNQSLLTGIFPSCMKAAMVKPLLKKTSLDPNVL